MRISALVRRLGGRCGSAAAQDTPQPGEAYDYSASAAWRRCRCKPRRRSPTPDAIDSTLRPLSRCRARGALSEDAAGGQGARKREESGRARARSSRGPPDPGRRLLRAPPKRRNPELAPVAIQAYRETVTGPIRATCRREAPSEDCSSRTASPRRPPCTSRRS